MSAGIRIDCGAAGAADCQLRLVLLWSSRRYKFSTGIIIDRGAAGKFSAGIRIDCGAADKLSAVIRIDCEVADKLSAGITVESIVKQQALKIASWE